MTHTTFDIRGDEQVVLVEQVRPNPWNPNEESEFMREKLRASLSKFGQVSEVVVRQTPDGAYEIIDGEHRWQEAKNLGADKILVRNLGVLPDDSAKVLTMAFNELHGQRDAKKMGELLADLQTDPDWRDLKETLPFSDLDISTFVRVAEETPKIPESKGGGPSDSWVDIKIAVHESKLAEFDELVVQAGQLFGVPAAPDIAVTRGAVLMRLVEGVRDASCD